MTRREEIEQAMKESVAETIYASGWGMTQQATDLLECAFTKGAEWADRTMLDKVCEWLKEHFTDYVGADVSLYDIHDEELVEYLKKVMQE